MHSLFEKEDLKFNKKKINLVNLKMSKQRADGRKSDPSFMTLTNVR
jgi:hypothetical protein